MRPIGINKITGMPGPAPNPPRDGDKKQARQRINVEVRSGRRPHPNELPCFDCGHPWKLGEPRHEYDHYRGYKADHHFDVQSVCTLCHAKRDSKSKAQTHCRHGHEFTEQNTIIRANGCRACRECRKAHDRKRVRPEGFWKKINDKRRCRGRELQN